MRLTPADKTALDSLLVTIRVFGARESALLIQRTLKHIEALEAEHQDTQEQYIALIAAARVADTAYMAAEWIKDFDLYQAMDKLNDLMPENQDGEPQ